MFETRFQKLDLLTQNNFQRLQIFGLVLIQNKRGQEGLFHKTIQAK
jgi:hypothetical protein